MSRLEKVGDVINFRGVIFSPVKEQGVVGLFMTILSDLNMPIQKGLDFLEEQMIKGCRCEHFALISGHFSKEDVTKAKSLGIEVFQKPFKLKQIIDWLDPIEKTINKERKLSDWILKRMAQVSK